MLPLRPARTGLTGLSIPERRGAFATVNAAEICPVFNKNLLRSIQVSKDALVMCDSIVAQPLEMRDVQTTIR
jgi:hypothetical protein